MARIAKDPVTREWWTYTEPCQTPFNSGRIPASAFPGPPAAR